MEPELHNRPSSVLRREHQVILRVLGVLERLVARAAQGTFEAAAFNRCVEFFRLFADRCHHAKEEDLLFPVLEQLGMPRDGGPIGVMLREHEIARELTRKMAAELQAYKDDDAAAEQRFLSTARQYHALLTNHIFKEDNILFNMGDQLMSDAHQQQLCARFGEVGCRAFEGQRGEDLERLAAEFEQSWPGA